MKNQIMATIVGAAIVVGAIGILAFKPAPNQVSQYVYVRCTQEAMKKFDKMLICYPDGKVEEIPLLTSSEVNVPVINAQFNKLGKEGYVLLSSTETVTSNLVLNSTYVFGK